MQYNNYNFKLSFTLKDEHFLGAADEHFLLKYTKHPESKYFSNMVTLNSGQI